MKRNRIEVAFVAAIMVGLCVSCQSVKETEPSVKNVLLDIDLGQELRLSEIADTVEVILLEQTDDSDIAMVERFIPYKDRYYVMNSIGFSNGRVHVFDKNGHFMQKIDKRGEDRENMRTCKTSP